MACAPYGCVRSLGVGAARPRSSCEAHASAWPAGGVRGRPIWSSGSNLNPVRVKVRAALVASDSSSHYLSDVAMWGPENGDHAQKMPVAAR